jgi:hypothetical protein
MFSLTVFCTSGKSVCILHFALSVKIAFTIGRIGVFLPPQSSEVATLEIKYKLVISGCRSLVTNGREITVAAKMELQHG